MGLAFGGTRADSAPGDQVSVVLGADQVEVLGACRQAHVRQVQQQLPGEVQALVDLERIVEVRVVDQSLPANRGPRFLEVDTHHHEDVFGKLVRDSPEPRAIVPGGCRVVNGTGTDDYQQAVVLTGEDAVNGLACIGDSFGCPVRNGDIAYQLFGRYQLVGLAYPQVVCGGAHWLFRFVTTGEDFPAGQKAANIPPPRDFWQPGRPSARMPSRTRSCASVYQIATRIDLPAIRRA